LDEQKGKASHDYKEGSSRQSGQDKDTYGGNSYVIPQEGYGIEKRIEERRNVKTPDSLSDNGQ
jgi:hypothetical protein